MKAYPVTVLCRVMGVSRSGFYEYFRRYIRNLVRPPAQSAVASRARLIFKQSHGSYGSRRIAEQLKAEGHRVGRYKARCLMRQLGLKVKISRRYKLTTDSGHSFPVAQNLVNRNFEVGSPNVTWTADITYVWTLEGWLYLAVVMDLCSRQIVGWAMDRRMKKKLTLEAPPYSKYFSYLYISFRQVRGDFVPPNTFNLLKVWSPIVMWFKRNGHPDRSLHYKRGRTDFVVCIAFDPTLSP
jgi:transposase InsO family protein